MGSTVRVTTERKKKKKKKTSQIQINTLTVMAWLFACLLTNQNQYTADISATGGARLLKLESNKLLTH